MTEPKKNKIKPPTLGVVAISYNEERDLEGFISHLQSWVDEIVIIDDGSSDRTAEIAMAANPNLKFIVSPRKEGEFFSHQRNKGIAASGSDWLLHMDIDERVPPALAREMILNIQDKSKDAFRYRRLNYFLHRPMQGGDWQDWNLVHLAKRNVLRFSGMYHEKCVVDTTPERIGQLKEKMWHLNDESYKERMFKSMRYCLEISDHIDKKGIRVNWRDFLLRPLTEFIKQFIVKQGYRDGTVGLLWALHAAEAAFRAYALAWDRQNRVSRTDIESLILQSWSEYGNDLTGGKDK